MLIDICTCLESSCACACTYTCSCSSSSSLYDFQTLHSFTTATSHRLLLLTITCYTSLAFTVSLISFPLPSPFPPPSSPSLPFSSPVLYPLPSFLLPFTLLFPSCLSSPFPPPSSPYSPFPLPSSFPPPSFQELPYTFFLPPSENSLIPSSFFSYLAISF